MSNPARPALLLACVALTALSVPAQEPAVTPAAPPGAAYGSRLGERKTLLAKGGGTQRHLDAVQQALGWLARHQNTDGGWRVTAYKENCGRQGVEGTCTSGPFGGEDMFDAGVSGLALLAFLGAGYTHLSHDPILPGDKDRATAGDVVKNGLKHLMTLQGSDGALGPMSDKFMYNHVLGTLALCEAYGMTSGANLADPARRAVDFLIRARNKGAAWRYTYQCGDNDASVTGLALLALHAADRAGIPFDRAALEDGRRFMDKATTKVERDRLWTKPGAPTEGKSFVVTGYLSERDAGSLVVVQGRSEMFEYTPTLTALRSLVGSLIGNNDMASPGVDTLTAYPPPKWNPEDAGTTIRADFYYWYLASHALVQALTPSDARWRPWNAALTAAVVDTQNAGDKHRGTCREGSWEPVDRWSVAGGRVFTTATAALALECYYRYPRPAAK